MKHGARHVIFAFTSALLLLGTACSPASGPAPVTDAALMANLAEEHVKLGSRDSSSKGAEKAALWIQDQCKKMNPQLQVTLQSFEEQTVSGKVRFHNVLASSGKGNRDFVLIAAHFDTKFFPPEVPFQGANDGASGVAALLGMMQALQHKSLPMDVVFAFFDGEEARYDYGKMDGLHGSRHLAEKWKADGTLKRCKAMILLDMIGDKDLNITLSRDTDNRLRHLLFSAAEKMNLRKHVGEFTGTILDDHVPFQNNGIPCIDLIDFQYGPENSYWHTSDDTLDKISGESMKIAADLALALYWQIAGGAL